jgi:hypothetical protein
MSKKAPDSSRSAKGSSGHASTSSSSHSSGVQPTQQQTPPPHQQLAATTSTSRTSTNSSSASHSHHTAASSQSTNGAAAPPPASGLIPRLHATPRSDIPVKRGTDTHCSSSSSRFAGSHPPVFVALPPLLGTHLCLFFSSFFFFFFFFFVSLFFFSLLHPHSVTLSVNFNFYFRLSIASISSLTHRF